MKFHLLPLICVTSSLAFIPPVPSVEKPLEQLTGQDLVNYVNSAQSLFTIEHNEHTEKQMKFRLMNPKYAEPNAEGTRKKFPTRNIRLNSIPSSFDARDAWPACSSISFIRDQSTCGSCWAFATAEVISDRTCIASGQKEVAVLSPEDILSCCGSSCGAGCDGGLPIEALKWWTSTGVVTGGDYNGTGCIPYSIPPCTASPCEESETPVCSDTCQSGYEVEYADDKHKGESAYFVDSNVKAIQSEILTNGPVSAAFYVYEDFYKYKKGVYKHVAGGLLGGHAVKIIGWGTNFFTPYWIVANSWGESWGEQGYFRIHRGSNEVGIEAQVTAGKPASN